MDTSLKFKKWASSFSGCDGGDIGNTNNRSKWVCGIESGGGHDAERLEKIIESEDTIFPKGFSSWEENIRYIFNWQIMKLLSVIDGGNVSQYKNFAETNKPFVEGSIGYFKMNLYPIAFKNTSQNLWQKKFSLITGFESKSDYLKWCNNNRLPNIRNWVSMYNPEIVICLGKTYKDQFKAAFSDVDLDFKKELIDNRELNWVKNKNGTLVFVLPFMVNRNGLVKHTSIERFGRRIREIMDKGC